MQVTMNDRAPAALLAVSLVLMASGSLRDLLSPWGYWSAWAVWAGAALAVSFRDAAGVQPWASGRPPAWVMGSYALLCLGMVVSAAVNRDGTTAYQALKVAVIAGMFVAMWRLALRVGWRDLVRAAAWAIGVVLVSLALSKVWNPAGQVLVSGPRQGTFLAVYGVLWKAGAFFLPIFLADLLVRPAAKAWVLDGLMIAACVFLVLIDGSRTGLLLLGAIAIGFLACVTLRGDWGRLWRRLRWLWLVPVLLVALQLLNMGVRAGMASAAAAEVSMDWRAEAAEIRRAVQEAVARTLDTRIGQGDPARTQLLREGVPHAIECQPLGCGFGTTGADVLGAGSLMAVHNAYIAALGDFGVLGLAGLLGFLAASGLPAWRVLRHGKGPPEDYFVLATAGAALAYGMSLMLNTFTTEMSEWGYLILMLAFAWTPPRAA